MPPNAPLVAPILLPNGSIHFAAIKPNGTAQDAINVLLETPEVKEDVLGDLASSYVDEGGWGLQKVIKHDVGKAWEEDELKALDFSKSQLQLLLFGLLSLCMQAFYLAPLSLPLY